MSTKYRTSNCKSCGASIIWCHTIQGKKMPVDANVSERGTFVLEERTEADPYAIFVGGKSLHRWPRYRSHFSTCPEADEHRKS
jgi:hypothetical protein